MTVPAIQLTGVSKSFKVFTHRSTTLKEALLRRGRAKFELLPVLQDVNLTIPEGQALGIVGRNGAGKSTMLKVVSGLMPPDEGKVTVRGRVSTLLELGAGFQTEYSGAENIYLYGALMGLGRRFIQERLEEILDFAGPEVTRHIDNAVKTYSSGMYMRLAFAVAVHVDPDILIIDEVLAVGDEAFQKKCFERAADLRARGKTMVLVSHDMGAVRRFCDRALWIDQGTILADGSPDDVTRRYLDSVSGVPVEDAVAAPRSRPAITISELGVHDAEGHPVDAVRSKDQVHVSFDLEAAWGLIGVQLALRWISAHGECVMATAVQQPVGSSGIAPGKRTWTCTFDSLPLTPGSYRLEVTVTDMDSGEVISPPHERVTVPVIGRPSDGLITVAAAWQAPLDGDRVVETAGQSPLPPGPAAAESAG